MKAHDVRRLTLCPASRPSCGIRLALLTAGCAIHVRLKINVQPTSIKDGTAFAIQISLSQPTAPTAA